MDSLDAQSLVLTAVSGRGPVPELWSHDRSGTLRCAFVNSENEFTWPREAVAEMAKKWREGNAGQAPPDALALRDAHERFAQLLERDGAPREPDVVVHDFRSGELRCFWGDEKVVVVVDEIGSEAGRRT